MCEGIEKSKISFLTGFTFNKNFSPLVTYFQYRGKGAREVVFWTEGFLVTFGSDVENSFVKCHMYPSQTRVHCLLNRMSPNPLYFYGCTSEQ